MNYQPLQDFYCIPQSEEEAKEVITRAVAHGAGVRDCLSGSGLDGSEYYWKIHKAWGCWLGKTSGAWVSHFTDAQIRHLTLDQLREECPVVGELTKAEIDAAKDFSEWPEQPLQKYALNWPGGNNGVPCKHVLHIWLNVVVSKQRWESARRALAVAGEHAEAAHKDAMDGTSDVYTAYWVKSDEKAPSFINEPQESELERESWFKNDEEIKEFIKAGIESGDFILTNFTEDEVNNPSHYASGEIECIDAIRASMTQEEFLGYCKGNVIKYNWRWRDKGGKQSLEKAQWYQARMIEELSK